MINLSGKSNQEVSISGISVSTALVILGHQHSHEVEVAVIDSPSEIKESELRTLWRERSNNGDRKVVIAANHGDRVSLFGPSPDRQRAILKPAIAQRLAQNFLDAPDVLTAVREIVGFYDAHSTTDLGGIKNKGLFASHHLRENLPHRRDWADLSAQGYDLTEKRHRGLIEALGFDIAKEERNVLVLRTESPESRVVALVLEDNENFDAPSNRFPTSPISLGLSLAAEYNAPWLILIRKDQIRLHPCKDGVGVGQKGQAETYFELNLTLLDDDNVGLLPLIFSASSLTQGGEVDKLLGDSAKFAANLGNRLRERVYEQVVPQISIAVAKKLQAQGHELNNDTLQSAYSMTLKILFRLLFQAYAEDRGLLPAGRNEGFDANSLKELGKRHIDTPISAFGASASIWYDLVQVWDAIDVGNVVWQIPAYNGGLFGSDPTLHPEGAAIKQLQLPDSVLGPALQGLLIDSTEDSVRGPVDFRALSVREFGTIYEGLLESSLSLAEVDLTVDATQAWVPAKDNDEILAHAGDPYFHSASGERKATGSYFTPKFVVDRLVAKAIDPTIDSHLEKIAAYLRAGDASKAGREFFDFRVADLAMGSAHFLVAAVDRIEAKMRVFLAQPENTVPAVVDELRRLRMAAIEALNGDEIAISEVEDFSLLRRQIARRCIYGIDINYMAVELARLAIWIHTFVPGLPMSTLDHNLVHGNSLTGIGSIDEALNALVPGRNDQPTLFDSQIESGLSRAKDLLTEAAEIGEADKREIASARKLAQDAAKATAEIKLVFDVAVSIRAGVVNPASYAGFDSYLEAGTQKQVRDLTDLIKPVHLPISFPEVFLRDNPGFDCLIGNPPWEELTIEESNYWTKLGLLESGLEARRRILEIERLRREHLTLAKKFDDLKEYLVFYRKCIQALNLPGVGTGDIDLYQIFAWFNLKLVRANGGLGLVLPRSFLTGLSNAETRKTMFKYGKSEILTLKNQGNWVFESVGQQYSFALITSLRNEMPGQTSIISDVRNEQEFASKLPFEIPASRLESFSQDFAIPDLNSQADVDILGAMKFQPRFADSIFELRPCTELHATNDIRSLKASLSSATSGLPIYSGRSFNLWMPDTGSYFGYLEENEANVFLRERLRNQVRNKRSAFYGLDPEKSEMDYQKARIVFRDIARATDERTVIAALVPPNVFLTNKAPYLKSGTLSPREEAYVLGVISSIPFDWQARRYAELGMNFHILNNLSIPEAAEDTKLGDRLVQASGMLAAVDKRFENWAREVGVQIGTVKTPEIRNNLICEIDAIASLLYGLTEQQVAHIFNTFHRGWDYQARLDNVLKFYEKWKD